LAGLANIKIDKTYWHDATQTATFNGPVTNHAMLGPVKPIASAAKLDHKNVIGQLNMHRLVILSGTYTLLGGGTATHSMLATLYTKSGKAVRSVVANDPMTGTQVEISPKTKRVITPNFPVPSFVVTNYRCVTMH
jgi:hypothetical protein